MPWSFKVENGTPIEAPQFRMDEATIDCTCQKHDDTSIRGSRHETTNRIDVEGLFLFLRPETSPTVPMNSPICYYACLDERVVSDMVTTDYLFEMQSGSGASRL